MSQFIVYTAISAVVMIDATTRLASWELYRKYGPLPALLSTLVIVIWLSLFFFAASRTPS